MMEKTKTEDKKIHPESWIKPGNRMSQEEFVKGVQKAEEGLFTRSVNQLSILRLG